MGPTQRLVRLLISPLGAFLQRGALGGTVLIVAAAVALMWANSPWAASYNALWKVQITLGAEGFGLSKPLILWVNDLLMAVFFLLVGLEIKREMVTGELNSLKRALLPVVAAVGGMVVPALIFVAVAPELPELKGWGVPMATDIAFALGILKMLGKRVPGSLIVFLAALAIIDDLGAILVIALFYTEKLSFGALGVAGLCTAVLVAMNLRNVRNPWVYVLVGLPLWVGLLKSGIHATIAGVIVGVSVPARAKFSREEVLEEAHELLAYAKDERRQDQAFRALKYRLTEVQSPVEHLEHALHGAVAFVIVPIFALANAGVSLEGLTPQHLLMPVSFGVFMGLFLGKPVGVILATWIAVRTGAASLPADVGWRHVTGLGVLAGIGFTMALFIAGLAYGEGTELHVAAKLGIMVASVGAAVVGLAILAGAQATPALRERAVKPAAAGS